MVESGRVREPELEDEIDGLGGRVGAERVGEVGVVEEKRDKVER